MTQSANLPNHEIQAASAHLILDWIRNRGGIQIWESVNLSNLGASWTGPATDRHGNPSSKPNYQCESTPSRTITDIAEVAVVTPKEVKRFHVGTYVGSQGFSVKVTDGGSRRIRKAVEKAEEQFGVAWYEFDYDDYDNAVIFIEGDRVPLAEFAAAPQNNLNIIITPHTLWVSAMFDASKLTFGRSATAKNEEECCPSIECTCRAVNHFNLPAEQVTLLWRCWKCRDAFHHPNYAAARKLIQAQIHEIKTLTALVTALREAQQPYRSPPIPFTPTATIRR